MLSGVGVLGVVVAAIVRAWTLHSTTDDDSGASIGSSFATHVCAPESNEDLGPWDSYIRLHGGLSGYGGHGGYGDSPGLGFSGLGAAIAQHPSFAAAAAAGIVGLGVGLWSQLNGNRNF